MILSFCDSPEVLSVMRIINMLVMVIKIIVPIALMVSLTLNYFKAVHSNDEDALNKANKSSVPKIIAAVLIFCIPTAINIIAKMTDDNFEYSKCLSDATLEGIKVAYSNRIETLLSNAEESLTFEDYNIVKNYYDKLKDKGIKEQYKDRMNTLTKMVNKLNTPPRVYTSDNILSGKYHGAPFLMKITHEQQVYYCIDDDNTCNPDKEYKNQIWFSENTKEYIRFKACVNDMCTKVDSYQIKLEINLKNPSVSTSGGRKNPHAAAFYKQTDNRWAYKTLPISPYQTYAAAACGYVSTAMLLTGITRDYSITPTTIVKDLENSGKRYYYKSSDCSGCGGMMYYYAIYNSYLKQKYGYEASELFNNFGSSGAATKSYKKEAIVESLKMGNMILLLVPNHYIALVGIDENEYIYVYNPNDNSAKMKIDNFYSTYYDYRGRCTANNDCGLQIAYEVYPKTGSSLSEWRKIE